ncbi:MAG: hypothetical protein EOM67_14035, partial [Spirochaetia bacterium]|nr:hypothetical protein [Spirochaetia bacterium]
MPTNSQNYDERIHQLVFEIINLRKSLGIEADKRSYEKTTRLSSGGETFATYVITSSEMRLHTKESSASLVFETYEGAPFQVWRVEIWRHNSYAMHRNTESHQSLAEQTVQHLEEIKDELLAEKERVTPTQSKAPDVKLAQDVIDTPKRRKGRTKKLETPFMKELKEREKARLAAEREAERAGKK